MNVSTLLSDCQQRGIHLEVVGRELRYRAPANVLTPPLLADLRAHKPEILQALQSPPPLTSDDHEAIHEARRHRKAFGGGMRQAGVIAAGVL